VALPEGTRVAVVALESPSAKLTAYTLDELQGAITNGKKLTVVERRNLEPLRNEFDFGMTGDVDDATAARVGRFLGATVVISGTFTFLGDRCQLRFNAVRTETAVYVASPTITIILRDSFIASLLPQEQQPLPEVVPAEREPGLATRYYNSGFVHYEAKEYLEAIQDFSRTLEINSTDTDALFYRACSYNERGDYIEVIANYTVLIRLQPDVAVFYANRGDAYARRGDSANALADQKTASRLDPSYTAAARPSVAVAPPVTPAAPVAPAARNPAPVAPVVAPAAPAAPAARNPAPAAPAVAPAAPAVVIDYSRPASYTITFDSQGGSDIASQTVTQGGAVPYPAAPVKAGVLFGGWDKEAGGINPCDYTAPVTGPATLYAKWLSENEIIAAEFGASVPASNIFEVNNASATAAGEPGWNGSWIKAIAAIAKYGSGSDILESGLITNATLTGHD
jgi:hypothetical protein